MAGIYNGPARGGTRGGRNEFKRPDSVKKMPSVWRICIVGSIIFALISRLFVYQWEDVKSDKDRENYIGHSLKASVGRWQKNRDIFWYTREKNADSKADSAKRLSEMAAIKAAEDRRMNAVLRGESMPSPERNLEDTNLDSVELKKLLTGNSGAFDEEAPGVSPEEEERVQFKNVKGSRGGYEKLDGVGYDEEAERHRPDTADKKKEDRKSRKERKEEKRQEKKIKKEMKKKKEKKKIKKLLEEKLKGKGLGGVGTVYGDLNL